MGRRGLSTKTTSLTVIKVVTVVATLLVAGFHVTLLLAGPPFNVLFSRSLTLVLIALATYSWMIVPIAGGVAISVVVMLITGWAWALVGGLELGMDLAALTILLGIGGLQQHRRRRRLHRLEQALDDLEEDGYLNEQNFRLTQRAHEALQRKLARYQQLQTIAESLSRLVNLEAIAQLAVERIFELIGKSDACLLFLVDHERQELSLYASKKAQTVAVIRTKHGDQFDRYALRTQRPLLVNDVRRDFRFTVAGSSDRPVGSVIACPLLVGESAEGVLRMDSAAPNAYTQDDLRFLDILLGLVDTAITNARLFAQTQQLAVTDGLTGLYRRQPFLDQLTREVARATRNGEPLAVLMLDLDNFKRYNDTFGHTAGDLVLKTVAETMRVTVPPDGMCARYGGEEFAVLLPKLAREPGTDIATRIRQAVEQDVGSLGRGTGQAVTVSLGVSVFPDDAQSELELIRLADQRLYQAKRAGKNQVCAS